MAARNVTFFFRDLARFVTFLFRTALIVLLFLPALLGAVAALIRNALTTVLENGPRRHRSVRPTILLGFLLGFLLGRSCPGR